MTRIDHHPPHPETLVAHKPQESREKLVSTFTQSPDSLAMKALSVVLISPSTERRHAISKALASAVQASIAGELTEYPEVDDLPQIVRTDYDVMLVDVDGDLERALDLIEDVCSANNLITVMVLSGRADSELLVRCMRAGAREFLTEPIPPSLLAEAFIRASVRRQETRAQKKTGGKILTFVGAKGGSGVTTISTNFAVALAKASGASVAIVDLHLRLGDVALMLGIAPQFSVSDALENIHRLDSDLLSTLFAKHTSGVSVLAAPDKFSISHPSPESVEKLLRVVRDGFPYVILDAGPSLRDMYGMLFEMADRVYLVTQVNLPDLRNANRLITSYFTGAGSRKLEVVLNRFIPRSLEIDEDSITKALTRPAKWKLPNEYASLRRAQNAGTPIALGDAPVSRALSDMARAACGQPIQPEKKRRFSLFG
jgi:pilus assembly protein CpaE